MTISYPLAIPTNVSFTRWELSAITSVALAVSPFTHQSQVTQFTGASWLVNCTLPIMARENAEQWIAFLLKLYGPAGTFLMGDPAGALPLGVATGTPLVNGSGQTGNQLMTKGWVGNVTDILKAGDYLQIGNFLYKNLTDADSDGSGLATLDIFPQLKGAIANDTPVILNSTKGIWRLVENEIPVTNISVDKLYEISFSAIEAIETLT